MTVKSGSEESIFDVTLIRGKTRMFVTSYALDANNAFADKKTLPKKGFFLPVGGGSKCYQGPTVVGTLNDNLFGKGRESSVVCAEIAVSTNQIKFTIQTQTTTQYKNSPYDGLDRTFFAVETGAGIITLTGDFECKVKLTSWSEDLTLNGASPSRARMTGTRDVSCSWFEDTPNF